MKTKRLLPLSLAISLCLAGCGGGGGGTASTITPTTPTTPTDNSPAAPVAQPAFLWKASTSTNRTGDLVLLNDGTYYLLYTAIDDPTTFNGSIQGHYQGPSSTGALTFSDSIDFNWDKSVVSATPSASLNPATLALNGGINYDVTGRNFTFTSTVQPASTLAVNLDGQYVSKDGLMKLTIASGVMSGQFIASGCNFKGKITPSTNYTTILSMALTFQGGTCTQGTANLNGVALYNASQGEISAMAVDNQRNNALLFQAVQAKP